MDAFGAMLVNQRALEAADRMLWVTSMQSSLHLPTWRRARMAVRYRAVEWVKEFESEDAEGPKAVISVGGSTWLTEETVDEILTALGQQPHRITR